MTILEYRAEQDLTQAECADAFGIGLRSLRRYESGQAPRRYIAERIKLRTKGAVTFDARPVKAA